MSSLSLQRHVQKTVRGERYNICIYLWNGSTRSQQGRQRDSDVACKPFVSLNKEPLGLYHGMFATFLEGLNFSKIKSWSRRECLQWRGIMFSHDTAVISRINLSSACPPLSLSTSNLRPTPTAARSPGPTRGRPPARPLLTSGASVARGLWWRTWPRGSDVAPGLLGLLQNMGSRSFPLSCNDWNKKGQTLVISAWHAINQPISNIFKDRHIVPRRKQAWQAEEVFTPGTAIFLFPHFLSLLAGQHVGLPWAGVNLCPLHWDTES